MFERNGRLFSSGPNRRRCGAQEPPAFAVRDWSALGVLVRAQALRVIADRFLLHALTQRPSAGPEGRS